MAKTKKQKSFRWQAYKPLFAAAFAVAGVFNLVGAVIAAGTAAGTAITNTATATYDDGSGGGPINAVSNTVTINVAEIAGLTVVSSGFDDGNGGSIVDDDELTFDFLVTNTGNAATGVFVPGPDGITVTNGDNVRVDIIDAGGNLVTVPNGGLVTQGNVTNLTTTGDNGVVPVDTGFTVRVTVDANAPTNPAGAFVSVQFGNTADNADAPADGTQNQQNIPDLTEAAPTGTANADDVRTVNNAGDGLAPVNGEREAAAFRQEAFNTAVTDLAQALLLKTSTYSDSGSAGTLTDDTLLYNLELRIGNQVFTSSGSSVDPANLEGTDINLNGGTDNANRILVSDAIPANTVFDLAFTPTVPTTGPTAGNWTVVYSTSDVATINALDAAWSTTAPTNATEAAAITRVGFIYDAGANGALTPTTAVTGFGFRVITNGLPATGGSIANVAQVFGESEGDTGNNLVFDESGDQRPNNLDDGVTPTNNTTTFDPATDFGVGNPADPEQTLNANDGTGTNGESNVVTIVPPVAGNLFNGPDNAPDAVGPTNTSDDFTNISAPVPAVGAPGTASDPGAVTITNQLRNPNATRLDNVTLLPIAPSAASTAAGGAGIFGSTPDPQGDANPDNDLPDGTQVTITAANGATQTYVYTAANGFRLAADPTNPVVPGVNAGTLQPQGTPGNEQDYTVVIDLPAGTPQVAGYSVPIIAFVDNNANATYEDATERATSNITVDRVYPGFMSLLKEARVVFAERDGVTLTPTTFTADQATLNTIDLRPGDVIEYRITYDNISEPAPAAPGNGNVTLTANNFVITEDGAAGGNTWGANTTHRTTTSATQGTVAYTVGGATPTTTEPADSTADVNVYVNTVGQVNPQDAAGNLTFRRQVN